MESWHHLYRVYEVIHAAEMNVRSLEISTARIHLLQHRRGWRSEPHNEIEILSLSRAIPTGGLSCLGAAEKERLIDFMNLFKDDVCAAVKFMEADGLKEFSTALSHVLKEIESLTSR